MHYSLFTSNPSEPSNKHKETFCIPTHTQLTCITSQCSKSQSRAPALSVLDFFPGALYKLVPLALWPNMFLPVKCHLPSGQSQKDNPGHNYCKHKLSTINIYSPKNCYIPPLLPLHNSHFHLPSRWPLCRCSTVPLTKTLLS